MILTSKRVTVELGDTTIRRTCDYCKHMVTFRASRTKRKIFFLGIPLYTTYQISHIACPICARKEVILKEKLEKCLVGDASVVRL